MIEWIKNNKSWIFSGSGVTIVIGIITLARNFDDISIWIKQNKDLSMWILVCTLFILLIVSALIINLKNKQLKSKSDPKSNKTKSKSDFNILIIDDKQFRVIDIMKNSGWSSTNKVDDIVAWDSENVKKTDIFFIDINGVGKKMGFKDEGLGLALAIKKKYPRKKVIIYSANTEGHGFHEALNRADAILEKNADPYEFLEILEQLTGVK